MFLKSIIRRLWSSTVVWSWAFNFLRLASGLLLLPLLLNPKILSESDFGMYFVLLNLNTIVAVLDFGFSPTLGRFISYAMAGATRLSAHGLAEDKPHGAPNYPLLWELLGTARVFYGFVTLAALVLLGVYGTITVGQHVHDTSSAAVTWAAWILSLAAICAETYFNVWNMFLRSMNHVLQATQIYFVSYAVRLFLSCLLLLDGKGLLSVPIASLATSLMMWTFSRRACMGAFSGQPRPQTADWRGLFKTIWPNSWRLGVYFGGLYIANQVNMQICLGRFGLDEYGKYGFSLQVMSIAAGMAGVWTLVKWPYLGQLITRGDTDGLKRVLWPRLWLQVATFAVLATAAVFIGPVLLRLIKSDKELLPLVWMAVLGCNGVLEAHLTVWNTLISMWNKLPMLWPTVATHSAAVLLNLFLVNMPGAEPGYLVMGPLLAGIAFNYWYWPHYGAKMIHTNWLRFSLCPLTTGRLSGI